MSDPLNYVYVFTNGGSNLHETLLYLYEKNKLEMKYIDYIKEKYGVCLIDVCKNNPKELLIELTSENRDLFIINILI